MFIMHIILIFAASFLVRTVACEDNGTAGDSEGPLSGGIVSRQMLQQLDLLTGPNSVKVVVDDAGWDPSDLLLLCGDEGYGCFFSDGRNAVPGLQNKYINIFVRNGSGQNFDALCSSRSICNIVSFRSPTKQRLSLSRSSKLYLVDIFTTPLGYSADLYCQGSVYKKVMYRFNNGNIMKNPKEQSRSTCFNRKNEFVIAYNNVHPFVNIDKTTGFVSGIEPKILHTFASREQLKLGWIDAKFTWGSKDPKTGEWNGVVGKVFYGEADAGITNIDITYERFLAVDYAGPAGSNEGVIMSKKPGPVSPVFNSIKVFTIDIWVALFSIIFVTFILLMILYQVSPSGFQDSADRTLLLLSVFAMLSKQYVELKKPVSVSILIFFYSVFAVFIMFFYESLILSTLVAVPYEKPINYAADIIQRGSPVYVCKGGSYESHFRSASSGEHKTIFEMATLGTEYNGIVPCSTSETVRQNNDVLSEGAARILPKTRTLSFRQEYFDKTGSDPFYLGKEQMLNFYTGLPVRKDAPWKPELDRLISYLSASGIISKWLRDEFNAEIFMTQYEQSNTKPILLVNTLFPVFILSLGLTLGMVLFAMEVFICKKKKEKRNVILK